MYSHHVALAFGQTGQEVEFYPPAHILLTHGAPASAATYRIYRGTQPDDDAPVVGPSSATLDSVSTTVSTVSGYAQSNRKRLYLNSTTGVVVGRQYLLSNASEQRELVVARSVTATYVDLDRALAFDYPVTTSTLVGLRHAFTIDATFIQDESNINVWGLSPLLGEQSAGGQSPPFRVEWRYTAGTVWRTWTDFDVTRHPAGPHLSLSDLRTIIPDIHLGEWVDQRGQDFMPQLKAAERLLQIDIRGAGYDPDSIQDPQVYQSLLLQKWAVVIGKGYQFTQPEVNGWLSMATADYTKMFEKMVGTAFRAWASTGTTGETAIDPPRALWLKGR